ncbi:MAG: hypothetical protein KatS3mg084_0607 [Candidatus Dojkabacteria bacterium]|nr:MAG: hypothetical protein KatS3mg084_0607 [Candidatus Dojkabacteria bacterium]
MIIAEKLAQKFSNLKSKGEIIDYFLFFNESRSLNIRVEDNAVGKYQNPTSYSEYNNGYFTIIFANNRFAHGEISNTDLNNFEEFIKNAFRTSHAFHYPIFIPERGIYPIVRAYSKTLADIIDIPEYALKISDLLSELDQMLRCKNGYADIEIQEGAKYAYSSRYLDEYYNYSLFRLHKVFKNKFSWTIESSDIYSLDQFQEIFSFLGDIYNLINSEKAHKLKDDAYHLILPPHVFNHIFEEQVLQNINGKTILQGRSIFKKENFEQKSKVLGTLSLSYDPLINLKPGSYKFTTYGLKPAKQYFIRFGKLDTPVLDAYTYSQLNYKSPTVEIQHTSNLKIEGIKRKTFTDALKDTKTVIYMPDFIRSTNQSRVSKLIFGNYSIAYTPTGKKHAVGKPCVLINLIDLIQNNRVELVEYIDGQIGLKLLDVNVRFI